MSGHRMLLISTDSREPLRVAEFKNGDWQGMAKMIGAKYIERVKVSDTAALAVDEEGMFAEGRTINPLASFLYGTAAHGSPIYGDALFGIEEMSAEGLDWGSPDAAELEAAMLQVVESRQR